MFSVKYRRKKRQKKLPKPKKKILKKEKFSREKGWFCIHFFVQSTHICILPAAKNSLYLTSYKIHSFAKTTRGQTDKEKTRRGSTRLPVHQHPLCLLFSRGSQAKRSASDICIYIPILIYMHSYLISQHIFTYMPKYTCTNH